MRLSELKVGERGVIVNFEGVSNEFGRRLYDMGISLGSEVILLSTLGFGRLFYISVNDIEFCLRETEAKKIMTERKLSGE